jgi:hypothetical protein
MGTTQITGSMIITNIERLNDPRFNLYADVFGSLMTSNLMEFRLLKNGVAELNAFDESHRSRLTPTVFAEALITFLHSRNIVELAYKGEFLFIETQAGANAPVITKVSVDTDKVTVREAELNWVVKESVNA